MLKGTEPGRPTAGMRGPHGTAEQAPAWAHLKASPPPGHALALCTPTRGRVPEESTDVNEPFSLRLPEPLVYTDKQKRQTRELCSQDGTAAGLPGSWLRASWGACSLSCRGGAPGGRPGAVYGATGSGPEGSGKLRAAPEGPQPGPSSTGPGGEGTGNRGTLAGRARWLSGSVGGAAPRERRTEA